MYVFDTAIFSVTRKTRKGGNDMASYNIRRLAGKIISLPEFVKGGYKLYEDVPVRNIRATRLISEMQTLEVAEQTYIKNEAILDLIICKNEKVILCILEQSMDRRKEKIFNTFLRGMPLLKLSNSAFTADGSKRILMYITKQIQNESTNRFTLPIIPMEYVCNKLTRKGFNNEIIHQFLKVLEEEHLIQEYRNRSFKKKYNYLPTDYGSECGLIKSYAMDSAGETCYEIAMTENIIKELEEIISWKVGKQKSHEGKYSCYYPNFEQ